MIRISPGSAERLVRRGEIANRLSVEYSLRNISAKNYQNWLRCVEVSVQHQCRLFETQCIDRYNGNLVKWGKTMLIKNSTNNVHIKDDLLMISNQRCFKITSRYIEKHEKCWWSIGRGL